MSGLRAWKKTSRLLLQAIRRHIMLISVFFVTSMTTHASMVYYASFESICIALHGQCPIESFSIKGLTNIWKLPFRRWAIGQEYSPSTGTSCFWSRHQRIHGIRDRVRLEWQWCPRRRPEFRPWMLKHSSLFVIEGYLWYLVTINKAKFYCMTLQLLQHWFTLHWQLAEDWI